ncbi:MAG: hypothetical protein QNI92_06885 [Desulfobacterales bacterium]|nr:hypothetical protein [Desulfobacterales bacterium]MDJ0914585.1 hypothetical protein [Desulfobacterales bacterium]
MPNKYCPHCGKRTGFEVKFNVSCRLDAKEEKCFLRICQTCGGRFMTIQSDERLEMESGNKQTSK